MRWQSFVVVAAAAGFFLTFAWFGFRAFSSFAVPGFDTGIFAQGTYLLSRLDNPVVTLRGLHIFGDHSSFILVFVAPLYAIWSDPRLLLLLQAVALTVPSLVVYRLGLERIGRTPAMLLAVTFFAMPAVQWTAAAHFHPESLATAFLALGIWAFLNDKPRALFAFLALAVICKEDVSFVVAAFGILMFVEGKKRWGSATILFSAGYFVIVSFVVMPLINGNKNLYFQRNYGVEIGDASSLFIAAPAVLLRGLSELVSTDGLAYLALVLAPVLFLPLLRARWLLPIVPPLLLNFASLVPYQQQISYQYLATSVPFVIVAALMGAEQLKKLRPVRNATCMAVAVAVVFTNVYGPVDRFTALQDIPAETLSARKQALRLIPDDAPVSALYNLNPHLINRQYVYEFPNPFKPANFGFTGDDVVSDEVVDRIEYVVLEPALLDESSKAVYEDLSRRPNWLKISDSGGVVVLERTSTTPSFRSPIVEGTISSS